MNTVYNKALHRYAVLTACCTFLLLVAGALVTSNDAGLSIPDWPLAYGSLTPPMVGGIRYEFTHRVIATCIGVLTIGLATWLWRAEKRQWMRWLGLAALGGVIAQGILGGATVLTYQLPAVSAAHATLAQLFFSTVVSIAVFTSAWWSRNQVEADDPGSPRVRTLIVWTLAAVFLQLVMGAAFRHKGFGIIPHLIGAVIVTILIFMTAGALKRRFAGIPALRSSARYLHILIGVQLLLGVGAYWSRLYAAHFPQPIPVMVLFTVVHTVTGALVLAVTLVTALLSYRMIRAGAPVAESAAASQQVAQ
ncbi:MAG TPA: COX15/CtaA family protein [Candidatus Acidoferrales bacterium]|jgi:cytochrome c oxidase assembly protein subunit 15|nr:COX15/CtaA family protein [Candidatus Acidoferrales bacterium]